MFGVDLVLEEYPEVAHPGDLVTVKWLIRVNRSEDLTQPIIRFTDLRTYELLGWEQLAVLPSGTYSTPIYITEFIMPDWELNILAEIMIEDRAIEWERKYDQRTFKIMLI